MTKIAVSLTVPVFFLLVSGATFRAHAQILRFSVFYTNGIDGVDGLEGARNVVLSPDNRHVYVAGSVQHSLVVFSRDPVTGRLTFIEAFQDGFDGVDGLQGAFAIAISPDGAFLYVAGSNDAAVAIFERNSVGGTLTFVGFEQNIGMPITGLMGTLDLVVSPDGNHLYVTGSFDDALSVYTRNPTTGELNFTALYLDSVGGIDGLDGVIGVDISPDGNNVYVTGYDDNAVAVFDRTSADGMLTFAAVIRDGVAGVDGLMGAFDVLVAKNGAHVYVAADIDDAVALFSRNPATGELTYTTHYRDGVDGVFGLDGAGRIAESPDGTRVYATAFVDDTLTEFRRDPVTGALEFLAFHADDFDGVDGLDGAGGVAVSADGLHVYATGAFDGAIALFDTFLSLVARWPQPITLIDLVPLIR